MAERVINNETYRFEKLKAFAADGEMCAALLTTRLMKFLGPAWNLFPSVFSEKPEDRMGAGLAIVGSVASTMDPYEAMRLWKELCALAQIKQNGKYEPVVPEFHLRDEDEAFQVASFVLEVQYGRFFGERSASPSSETKAAVFPMQPPAA